jgi:hypothetical protein
MISTDPKTQFGIAFLKLLTQFDRKLKEKIFKS